MPSCRARNAAATTMAVDETDDVADKKMKYPKSVFFIILNEFCERFSFYGMRACLSHYFKEILLYEEKTATVMYHTFTMFAFFFPLIGAMIADSWLGKFRTIFYLSIVYAIGQLLLSVSSVPALHLPVRAITILGLFLIAVGTGGIKPCVSAFGGDQFKLPEQEVYLTTFFSLFYLAINSGSLISTFITPILRKDVHCFDQESCYPLAFFVPSVLMILSIVIFFAGKRLYKVKPPEGNMVLKVAKCITHAVGRKISSKSNKREHWLDYADDKYDDRFIEDIKSVFKVIKLFLPLPFFWALFDQQGSRWTFQADRMNGYVFGYVIKPDQFQVVNPLLIVLFIPIFQFAIYPVIEKFLFINTPLKKLTTGGILAGLSFIISAIIEFQIESIDSVQPSKGLTQVRFYNVMNCRADVEFGELRFVLDALESYQNLRISVNGTRELQLQATFKNCPELPDPNTIVNETLTLIEERAMSWGFTKTGLEKVSASDSVHKSQSGEPNVRALIYRDSSITGNLLRFIGKKKDFELKLPKDFNTSDYVIIEHEKYNVTFDDQLIADNVDFEYGAAYTIVGSITKDRKDLRFVMDAEPDLVHMFWLLPQYIVITMGEIMFSITGLEFAFTQAPVSMKSLLQACWLLTVAAGNLIVVIIAESQFFNRQVYEFFLFAGLMFADMFIFAIMAKFYEYVDVSSSDDNSIDDDDDDDVEDTELKKRAVHDSNSADL
ncbi:peptide transporter family 1-like [Phymastichus coffea]|uniref:peptide transporter family 1-like n=1 Tax=Phymastichus coffea TaxID=108790 RepID=UPI00273C17DA|nr:peptide transporter family 1-like [Phymastichus coffea]